MAAYRATGSLAPKPEGGWRYSKLDPHRDFLIRRVTEKDDITMPQLAAELAALGTKVTPARSRTGSSARATASKKTLRASEQGRSDVRQAREHWRTEASAAHAPGAASARLSR
jgi:hypothetical protein